MKQKDLITVVGLVAVVFAAAWMIHNANVDPRNQVQSTN